MQVCDYCGGKNTDEAANCSGCGNPLRELAASQNPKKSKGLAVFLALIFGPLGLLYVGGEGLMIVIFIAGLSFLLIPVLTAAAHFMNGFGLLFSLVGRLAAAWWASVAIDRQNADPDVPDAQDLLVEAAKLENQDFALAIAKYEEIIARFPKTTAATSARNCLQTLRGSQGQR